MSLGIARRLIHFSQRMDQVLVLRVEFENWSVTNVLGSKFILRMPLVRCLVCLLTLVDTCVHRSAAIAFPHRLELGEGTLSHLRAIGDFINTLVLNHWHIQGVLRLVLSECVDSPSLGRLSNLIWIHSSQFVLSSIPDINGCHFTLRLGRPLHHGSHLSIHLGEVVLGVL